MKAINLIVLTLVFFISGCADKKYVNADTNDNVHASQYDCSLRFKSNVCLNWQWELKPTEEAEGSLSFETYTINNDGSVNFTDLSAKPTVKLWMPDMGHGSSPTTVSQQSVGHYVADRVFFSMPGKWEIKFQIKDGNTVKDEVVVEYTL